MCLCNVCLPVVCFVLHSSLRCSNDFSSLCFLYYSVFFLFFFCIFAVDSYVSCTTVCICFNAPANQPWKNSDCLQQVIFIYYELVIILFIDSQRHCRFIIIFFLRNKNSETYNCLIVNSSDRYPIQMHFNGIQLNIVSFYHIQKITSNFDFNKWMALIVFTLNKHAPITFG